MTNFAEFMCETNDEIDNSVFDLLRANDEYEQKKLLKEVFKAYKVPEIEGKEKRIEAVSDDIFRSLGTIRRSESWNMDMIGSAELAMEYDLEQVEIPFCHPFYICDDETDLFLTEENSCKNDPFYDSENGGVPCVCVDDCLGKRRGFCRYCEQKDESEK